MVTCEHAFCDANSLSTVCHQLLLLLSLDEVSADAHWAPSMEYASGGLDPMLVSKERLAL
jgi:hypothetical protein